MRHIGTILLVDYRKPVAAVIPGVQGRVLEVLARTDIEMSMRTVARLAGVSANRSTTILNQLVKLGIVERRDIGTTALVRLSRDNEASKLIVALAQLTDTVLARLRDAAATITPRPCSLIVFGSFVKGQARLDSDVDILAVRPSAVSEGDPAWTETLGKWSDLAARIVGNPVNLVVVSELEIPQLVRRDASVWGSVIRDGITLLGVELGQLGAVA